MITLSFEIILVVFTCVPLLLTAGFALFYNFRSLHRPAREKESIYACGHCGHIYAIARSRPMDRCPRCGELNEAVRA
jgi:hypothetical protein